MTYVRWWGPVFVERDAEGRVLRRGVAWKAWRDILDRGWRV